MGYRPPMVIWYLAIGIVFAIVAVIVLMRMK
jgi:tetrahydromethanopterin S-methyltransferase subunit F